PKIAGLRDGDALGVRQVQSGRVERKLLVHPAVGEAVVGDRCISVVVRLAEAAETGLHSVFVGAGPYSDVPVFVKTWNSSLTTWTYSFRPAAPFGSGGTESCAWMPSK